MTASAYEELLARLLPARRFGVVLGLERVRARLDRLGAPDRALGRVIHVGGTNGKGSTVAMIAALVRATGARVATYTSPHLSCLRERITIDPATPAFAGALHRRGAMVGEAELVAAAARVAAVGGDEDTFFEQITAMALVAIAAARVDVTVLEVGLGGRLDATNAVAADVSVVTGVAIDHAAILGATLAAIAGEKAGIFKGGQSAVIGASGEAAAVPVLIAAARAAGVRELVVIDDAAIAGVPTIGLVGAHQRRNAAAAIAAVRALGLPIHGDALAHVVHPGRFERIGAVILDGAHNPHGAAALATTLGALGLRPTLVIAASADKDVAGIAAALAPAVGAVIATRYQQDRALAPAALAAYFAGATTAPDLRAALAAAPPGPVLVAGSLFLVGEARVLLLGAPADPYVVTDPPATPAT